MFHLSKFGGVTRRWEWGKTGGGPPGTLAVDDVVGTDPVPEGMERKHLQEEQLPIALPGRPANATNIRESRNARLKKCLEATWWVTCQASLKIGG
jgi:hypothetical protein